MIKKRINIILVCFRTRRVSGGFVFLYDKTFVGRAAKKKKDLRQNETKKRVVCAKISRLKPYFVRLSAVYAGSRVDEKIEAVFSTYARRTVKTKIPVSLQMQKYIRAVFSV